MLSFSIFGSLEWKKDLTEWDWFTNFLTSWILVVPMTNSGSFVDNFIMFRGFVGDVIDLHLTLAISYSCMEAR